MSVRRAAVLALAQCTTVAGTAAMDQIGTGLSCPTSAKINYTVWAGTPGPVIYRSANDQCIDACGSWGGGSLAIPRKGGV